MLIKKDKLKKITKNKHKINIYTHDRKYKNPVSIFKPVEKKNP